MWSGRSCHADDVGGWRPIPRKLAHWQHHLLRTLENRQPTSSTVLGAINDPPEWRYPSYLSDVSAQKSPTLLRLPRIPNLLNIKASQVPCCFPAASKQWLDANLLQKISRWIILLTMSLFSASIALVLSPIWFPFLLSLQFISLTDRKAASAGFERLVMALTKAGLEVEVRNGNEGTLLVLVRASNERVLGTVVYRSRWALIASCQGNR